MGEKTINLLTKNYIPKKDNQQSEFLKKYPKYDGRGCLIAIFDTAVDLSLPGMQKTSTGLPKIVDCFDFTEEGNVETSTIKKIGNDRILELLSGRKVEIPQNWKNPSNQWHLGVKTFEAHYETLVIKYSQRQEYLNDLKNGFMIARKTKETWKTLADKEVAEKLSNNGAFDCIVWNDGEKWQACIISGKIENLENVKVLTNFRDEHEYCFILDDISCCVTIENDGNLLQLFIPYHEHGSYVAQVAAAHFPNEPEKDGLAPGAQIISINFIDWFEHSLEKFKKALIKCIDLGVDIINISMLLILFNESAIKEIIKEMVNEKGIIIIKSAGNKGPFLSSSRQETYNLFDEIFHIGSVFTADDNLTLFEQNNDDLVNNPTIRFYSSKGPMINGARGVTFTAPGAAIVQKPKWHLSEKKIFDGTSCAAPNVTGSLACLLTALKYNSIKYSPKLIHLILSNTAKLKNEEDRLKFGNGMIQINSAFEKFMKFRINPSKITFPTLLVNNIKDEKGIILYKLNNSKVVKVYSIKIENEKEEKIEWIFKLSPNYHQHIESTKIADNLFSVKIGTKLLKPGNVYYSEIHGYNPLFNFGPVFHLPITVIFPIHVYYGFQREISVKPPEMFNVFLYPLETCQKCTIKLVDSKTNTIKLNVVFEKIIEVSECEFRHAEKDVSKDWSMDIRWNKILEICIYQNFCPEKSCESKFKLTVNFGSINQK